MKKIIASISVLLFTGAALVAQPTTTKSGTDAKTSTKSTTDKTTVKTAEVKKQDATSKSTTATSKTAPSTTSVNSDKSTVAAAPAQSAAVSADKVTYAKFDKTVHDYGTVKKGANGDCVFTYKNTSKEPLVITNCYGSCGCTVPKWEKEPLMPGKSFDIKVHYDTNRPGKFEKTVTINFQNHAEPVVLNIKGLVEAPAAEVPFGSEPVNTGAPLDKNN
ncbi:MAG: hypothetical protein FD123_3676 [Bacteroidetes bacterium]|nr:MAG: hypothetical protein FD123_3676 [Bacteroidota bacterium]